MQTEATLKGSLGDNLRRLAPTFVVIRHEDRTRLGIADFSVSGCGWTSWWEVKRANPGLDLSGKAKKQALELSKMAQAGYARYIIYRELANGTGQSVVIAHPRDIIDIRTGVQLHAWQALDHIQGHDHDRVAREIIKVHTTWKRSA